MSTFINGSGKPRLILVLARPFGYIATNSIANPTLIATFIPHKLTTGMTVQIAGNSGSTPTINGTFQVTVINALTFTIPVNVTVAGSGGTFQALTEIYSSTGTTAYTATGLTETGSPTYSMIKIGHRVYSTRTAGGIDNPTTAKVIGKATGILTVDAWTNGTPTNGNAFRIDGVIVDLPRCQEMTEEFTPDNLLHSLYNGNQGSVLTTKMRGWKYKCTVDYSKYIAADTLTDMRFHLAQGPDDSLILIPRIDAPQFQYNVIFADPVQLTRQRLEGHRKVIFTFQGKENLPQWPIIDGYGVGYAQNYGTQL